jgi:hypothetical protein
MMAMAGRRCRGAIWGISGIGSSPERLLHGDRPRAEGIGDDTEEERSPALERRS